MTFSHRFPARTSLSLACAVAGLVVASLAASGAEAPPPAPVPRGLRLEPHPFVSRSGEKIDAELGTFEVLENRHAQHSRRIPLTFVRFPATTRAPGVPGPPIVYLAGGPGGSGIATAAGERFPLFMALREFGDVIAFDQRGTGRSNAIPFCPEHAPFPSDRPGTRGNLDAWLGDLARHCAVFWREQGVDLAGYTTEESAEDLEDLRRALGVDQLRLWGISYGTHLAFAFLREHERSVERAILASSEGPDETVKLPIRTDALLNRVAAMAKRQRATAPDVVAQLRAGLARLRTGGDPQASDGKMKIGDFEAQMVIGYLIKNPETWPLLVSLAGDMERGEFSVLAGLISRFHSQMKGLSGMPEAMDAASGMSAARRATVAAQASTAVLGEALNYPGPWLTEALGLTPLSDDFRAPLRSAVPALFLAGSLDGRTYLESQRELAAGFSRGQLVVIENGGHDSFVLDPEVLARMRAFLAGDVVSTEPIVRPEPVLFPSP